MPHGIPGERLIAFFSRRGNNYVNGTIVHLSRGNTEIIAEKLQPLTGGELFRPETVNPYPEDYRKTTEAARRELQQHIRPELKGKMPDMEQFRPIFPGFPNRWGTMPMAVQAFLARHDFSGKIIVPFCTHEGSGMGAQ